jgi:transposase
LRIESERVDELPVVMKFAEQMGIPQAIDSAIDKVHGNRNGLGYGQLAWGLIGAIATRRDHRLQPMEQWSIEHRPTLETSMGVRVADKDFTDDRLADLLDVLGDAEGQVRSAIEERIGQHIVTAYRLPTEAGRFDTTNVSVYHRPDEEKGLLAFGGNSKAHRLDLQQFVEALGTLDPAGIPLTTATLPGNQADDPLYWPMWQRMTHIIGHTNWLYIGDSKLHSAETLARIHRAGGWFLTPIPMKGNVPEEFDRWIRHKPKELTAIRLPDEKGKPRIVGYAFEVERTIEWEDPETGETLQVPERVLVAQRLSFRDKQIHDLDRRLTRAQSAMEALHGRKVEDLAALEAQVQAIVGRYSVKDYLSVGVGLETRREEKWIGRGRPGPHSRKRVIESRHARISVRRQELAIEAFREQAGWRAYGTNRPKESLTLQQAVEKYAGQFQVERGFQRMKGTLRVAPVFLRTDQRIRGLMLILSLALRLLTLLEFVARRSLAEAKQSLLGLYPAPQKTTARPTAERLLNAFEGITLHAVHVGKHSHRQLSDLSPLHEIILKCLGLPISIYTALAAQ